MRCRTYEPPQAAGAGPKSHLMQKALTALHEMGAVNGERGAACKRRPFKLFPLTGVSENKNQDDIDCATPQRDLH